MAPKTPLQKIYWTAAILASLMLAFLASVIFLNPSSVGNTDFVENINLWAFIWAVNFVLFLVLCFILARDLIKLFFEHPGRKLGRRIKSKLITTFIIFSLFPAILMSFLAFGLINSNLRLWFTSPSEQLLESSESVVDAFYEQNRRLVEQALRQVSSHVDPESLRPAAGTEEPTAGEVLQGLAVFDRQRRLVWSSNWRDEDVSEAVEKGLDGQTVYRRRRGNELERADIDLVLVAQPIRSDSGAVTGVVLGQHVIPRSVEFNALEAGKARVRFSELKESFQQIEVNYFLILMVTTLAIIVGFVWLGTYIARKITVPLEALAEGAHQLAEGNLDYRVNVAAVDELGVLLESFNRMAEQLRENRRELEKANEELMDTNIELAEGRNYTERILQNIGTGVMSVDHYDKVKTVNQAALRILKTDAQEVLNQPLEKIAGKKLYQQFAEMKKRARIYGSYRREIVLNRGEEQVYIAATLTANPQVTAEKEEFLVVLDELTELIRAQKSAAWQEVARRLAHEIKNPLTPIQLCAERVSSRFGKMNRDDPSDVEDFAGVLRDALQIIRSEAQTLKSLVEEFSRFARLPISRPVETELHRLLDKTLEMYDGSLSSVHIEKRFDPQVARVVLDPEQMRRVFINLIDNALDALAERERDRRLTISTWLNHGNESVSIEFADNGCGLAAADYENLFFPYFSKKKKGTGLGLTIVQQIVNDHSGYIRAEPNEPIGMKFTIEMPVRQTFGNTEQGSGL